MTTIHQGFGCRLPYHQVTWFQLALHVGVFTDPPNPIHSKDLIMLELDLIQSGDYGSLEQVPTFKIR